MEVIICKLKDIKWLVIGEFILVDFDYINEFNQVYKNVEELSSLYCQ